ncbi:DUF2218 domain-containing protein [Pseudohoeflea suaedae]|uniref:DUF2218 domain-containing protein n=1 Tax=Pseudohoeflea suaedae TaxID=877384 RepID=A0A4R5PQX9_9HYPH|nr:DUF2218 domain-containing protein [Pseudohoeflea suaedae]TDH39313.1 DUF2218 domain-containing protein [Pseudohoeflea suaedae]
MTIAGPHSLSGTAVTPDAARMLDVIEEHFAEHAEVRRHGALVHLESEAGGADIRAETGRLTIALDGTSGDALELMRTMLAEHLFYFAGAEPLELSWSAAPRPGALAGFHQARVVARRQVTPRMLRLTFACGDVTPLVGGDIHVRLLVPPKGREPVWPGLREDGRIAWPEGEDELLVRAYTIRSVDAVRNEFDIDVFQHAGHGVATPGADFARDAGPGDLVGLMGPGAGGIPQAASVLLVGDETALPAIARIVAEAPADTRVEAIIEVEDAAEEQPLPGGATLGVRWLHRATYPQEKPDTLLRAALQAIDAAPDDTFVWVACEKDDVRVIRKHLKSRGHDRKRMYVAYYWERQ